MSAVKGDEIEAASQRQSRKDIGETLLVVSGWPYIITGMKQSRVSPPECKTLNHAGQRHGGRSTGLGRVARVQTARLFYHHPCNLLILITGGGDRNRTGVHGFAGLKIVFARQ